MTREEAIHHLNTYSSTNGSGQTTNKQHNEAKRMAIKALEQEPVIDKIRAEILEEHENAYAREDYDTAYGLSMALDIIDKHKAEQE